jgi:hypothetical protein
MDTNRLAVFHVEPANPVAHHARVAAITVAALAVLTGALLASLWLASFFLFASLRLNPLHAGLWGWPDALLAWHDGRMPSGGRRLAGTALLGALVAMGGPSMGLYALWERTWRRRLYGSARFASEAEIRAAGLL